MKEAGKQRLGAPAPFPLTPIMLEGGRGSEHGCVGLGSVGGAAGVLG